MMLLYVNNEICSLIDVLSKCPTISSLFCNDNEIQIDADTEIYHFLGESSLYPGSSYLTTCNQTF